MLPRWGICTCSLPGALILKTKQNKTKPFLEDYSGLFNLLISLLKSTIVKPRHTHTHTHTHTHRIGGKPFRICGRWGYGLWCVCSETSYLVFKPHIRSLVSFFYSFTSEHSLASDIMCLFAFSLYSMVNSPNKGYLFCSLLCISSA
jgi:hypothetical protein